MASAGRDGVNGCASACGTLTLAVRSPLRLWLAVHPGLTVHLGLAVHPGLAVHLGLAVRSRLRR
jgi:hypothetical protein